MIITLIFVLLVIVGIVSFILSDRRLWTWWADDILIALVVLGFVGGGIGLIVCSLIIIGEHTNTPYKIQEAQIKRENIIEQVELLQSQYEDVADVTVLREVQNWNTSVRSHRYWTYNPWTSWFWNRRVTDSLEFIELKE